MRVKLPDLVEKSRIRVGVMGSDPSFGLNGAFVIPHGNSTTKLIVIASDGVDAPPEVSGWEHVSVSVEGVARTPTWIEMDYVRNLFWGPEEWVIQYHAPADQNVNNHNYVLHMWRPIGKEFPTPPGILVGVRELGTLNKPKGRKRHKPMEMRG